MWHLTNSEVVVFSDLSIALMVYIYIQLILLLFSSLGSANDPRSMKQLK